MKLRSVVRIYKIVVEFDPEVLLSSETIFADNSSSLTLRDDFQKFAEGIRNELKKNGYSIDNFEPSPNNDSKSISYYVTYHRTSDETPTTLKCMFKVRLANHGLGNDREQPWAAEKRQKKYFTNSEILVFEKKLGKKILNSKYRNIVVSVNSNSSSSYKDFNEALSKESVKLLKWSSQY